MKKKKDEQYICLGCKRFIYTGESDVADGNTDMFKCNKQLLPKVRYGGGYKCARFIFKEVKK